MKKLLSLVLSLFVASITGRALAQAPVTHPHPHPRIHEVHHRMNDQFVRIEAGLKSGKLTQAQADQLKAQLKAVQAQMDADYKTNGKRMLTVDQKKQLNEMLDQNSKIIYDEKHPEGGEPPAAGNKGAAPGAPAAAN